MESIKKRIQHKIERQWIRVEEWEKGKGKLTWQYCLNFRSNDTKLFIIVARVTQHQDLSRVRKIERFRIQMYLSNVYIENSWNLTNAKHSNC